MAARLQNILARLTIGVSALLVLWVTLFILYGVFSRYFLGASPIWFDEVARYAIILVAMLGMGGVWVRGAHMRVGVLEKRVPYSFRRAIIYYQWLLTLGLTAAMALFSFEYIDRVSFFKTPGLQISRSIPVASLTIGFGMLFFLVLLHGPKAMRDAEIEEET